MNAIALNGGVALLTGAAAAWPGDRQALRALGRCSRDLGAADERVDVSHVPALRTGSHGRLDIFGELRRDHCADYADRAMLTHQVAADTRDSDHPAGPRRSRPSSPGQPETSAFSTAGCFDLSGGRATD